MEETLSEWTQAVLAIVGKDRGSRRRWAERLAGKGGFVSYPEAYGFLSKLASRPPKKWVDDKRKTTVDQVILGRGSSARIPVIAFGSSGTNENQFTDQGYLVGEGMFTLERPGHVTDTNAFGVQVRGDSMEPRFHDGEVVIVDTRREPVNGDDAVVGLHSHDRYIKRYRKKGGKIYLESWNSIYPPIVVNDSDIKFRFKIVDHRPR